MFSFLADPDSGSSSGSESDGAKVLSPAANTKVSFDFMHCNAILVHLEAMKLGH